MKIHYCGVSTRGARANNEDAFAADNTLYFDDTAVVTTGLRDAAMDECWRVFAVADGMGGHASGEIAARLALQLLCDAFLEKRDHDETSIHAILDSIHNAISAQGSNSEHAGMGCTLTGAVFGLTKVFIFNIGDSRTYQLRGGYLSQVTKDHSLRSLPGMSEAPQNRLFSSLGGGQKEYTADIWDYSEKIKAVQALVITSDGYHEFPDIDNLESILAKDMDATSIEAEVFAAPGRGSEDNVTLLALAFK